MTTASLVPFIATYRLQFTPGFRFADARQALPYLRELGVSHIYASPITRARRGSTHGYDVCDPRTVNPELGTHEELLDLLVAVRQARMRWIQDVVPNHLAASGENPYWRDVLRHGRRSRWAPVFDIDWEHPELDGRLQLPVLAEPYGQALQMGRLTVAADDSGPQIAYGDLRLPLTPTSIPLLLVDAPECRQLARAVALAARIEDPERRERELATAWAWLADPEVRAGYNRACAAFPRDRLDRLLQEQPWRLAWWRTGRTMVGYRRFFAIDDLVATRIEDEPAFALMHGLAFDLADQGLIEGLRIDHIDGLREPDDYLQRLRQRLPKTLILVEKILAADEHLPERWPVAGTTGYDFLAGVVVACCHPDTSERFSGIHHRLTGPGEDPQRLRIRLREEIDRLGLGGDADRVARLIRRAHVHAPAVRDLAPRAVRDAVAAIMARFPVYRTYGRPEDRPVLAEACAQATTDLPAAAPVIEAVYAVLDQGLDPAAPAPVRDALLRFQQLSGPVMAKGCEDTFFYAFTAWICLNEVGGDPLMPVVSPREFIVAAAARGGVWPRTLNATATHDTKRGEDTRARLAALTWSAAQWEEFAAGAISRHKDAPHADDQYALLQTLVATWPADGRIDRGHVERLQACALKSLREAGQRTSWSDPDQACEARVAAWLAERCDPQASPEFHRAIGGLVDHLLPGADAVSLAMTVLKCTLPGVPDIYQGCEWPDLSLVDPDNRRPVDLAARAAGLAVGPGGGAEVPPVGDPRRKQAVLQRCLRARRSDPDLWSAGSAEPQAIAGDAQGLFVFRRNRGARSAIILADVRPGPREASIALGPLAEDGRWRDVLGGVEHAPGPAVAVATLLKTLPCAILVPVTG